MPLYEYDPPDRFVAGTVGQPGERTFFLQASGNGTVVSVALEKQQVAVLAERIDDLLDEVVRRSGGEAPVPALAPVELVDGVDHRDPHRARSRRRTGDGRRVQGESWSLHPDQV